ncbi:hypothetical protein PMAYCL1PPCAC_22914, partial [Pristionchus mayeri]
VEDSLVLRVNPSITITSIVSFEGEQPQEMVWKRQDGITFGVRAHECFGVLGINGAGKTSTFEMLTGNTLPSGGFASVGGVDCSKAPTNALMEDLTGRQSLIILAALHGYENPRKVADIVIICVGMQDHADKKTGNYRDEVEALVSNLIIMRDGSIVVEGSPQMIKNQFGGHYNFNIVLENASNVEEATLEDAFMLAATSSVPIGASLTRGSS